MTVSEAHEVLGVSAGSDARAIKRAYHRLLRRHRPDSDPDGFRRLRHAFEVASEAEAMRAFQTQLEPSHPQSPEFAPPGQHTSRHGEDAGEPAQIEVQPETASDADSDAEVDPDVVLGALARDEVQWAHQLVMDDRWAAAMFGDSSRRLRWATRLVGLRVLLLNRSAFDRLVSKYPDAFDKDDSLLVYLLRVSEEWSQLAATLPLPSALVAFASRASTETDPAVRRRLARDLGEWFMHDPVRGSELLDAIVLRSLDVPPFLHELVMEFEAELDAQPVAVPPAHSLRVLTRTTIGVALALALAVLFFADFGGLGLWPRIFRAAAVAGSVAGTLYTEAVVYEALPALRRRFLLACIRAGVEPSLAAVRLRRHPYLRHALEQDEGLELAFHLGRLAQLSGAR